MGKELEFEEGSVAKILIDTLKATFKKIPNWKTTDYNGID